MEIDLGKLSSADRRYVETRKKQAEADPFKPVTPNPFQPRAAASASNATAARSFGRAAKPGAPAPELRVDISGATMAALPPDGPWKLDVGPAPMVSDAGAGPRPVPVPPKADFFEKMKGLVVNAPATHALVGYALDNPKPGASRVALCDLRSGKPLGQFRTEGVMAPLALSDSGDLALMRMDEFGFGNSYRLELWHFGSEGLVKVWKFAPYGDMQGGDRDVKWARFLGPNRFATIGGKGKLVIWDLNPVRARTTVAVDEACTPGLSPDGKYLAFVEKGMVGVLDVEAGQVAALQPMPTQHVPWPGLGFSPSGKKLACVSGGKLYVWNTADGSALPEIMLTPIAVGPGVPPIWTDEDHVMVGDRYLIDVPSQVRLWQYDGGEATVGDRTGRCWFLLRTGPKQPGAVVPAKLPQPAALNALKVALADPNYFILRPGAIVSVDANGVPDASMRGKVVAALTARLGQIGAKVAAGSPLVLSANVTPGKEREVSYRTIGRGFQRDNFKIRPQISGVKLTYQGKVAWQASASTLPIFDHARLGPNESLADHVKKFEKPNYTFFENLEIPRLLARPRPGGAVALGFSQVSRAGVR